MYFFISLSCIERWTLSLLGIRYPVFSFLCIHGDYVREDMDIDRVIVEGEQLERTTHEKQPLFSVTDIDRERQKVILKRNTRIG